MTKKTMVPAHDGSTVLDKPAKRAKPAKLEQMAKLVKQAKPTRSAMAMAVVVTLGHQAQAKPLAKAAPSKKLTRKFPELTSAQRSLHGGITAHRDAFSIEAAKGRLATAVATKK